MSDCSNDRSDSMYIWAVSRQVVGEAKQRIKLFRQCSEAIRYCENYIKNDLTLDDWVRVSLLEWRFEDDDLRVDLNIEMIE